MDELELLKKQWQTREQELPHLTYNDIYKMLLKKSSSIVKWIFVISIAELVFWISLTFLAPESGKKVNDSMGLHNTLLLVNIFSYVVFAVFIFLFYKNYRKIKATDSVKKLMKNIIKTRRTVKYFVLYNVVAMALTFIGIIIYFYAHQDLLYKVIINDNNSYNSIPHEKLINIFFVAFSISGIIFIGLLILFYRLVYGILLRRLKRNYHELKKMELQ